VLTKVDEESKPVGVGNGEAPQNPKEYGDFKDEQIDVTKIGDN